MKILKCTITIGLLLTGFFALCQSKEFPYKIGRSKEFVRQELKSQRAPITEGITKSGETFIMTEDSSEMLSYIFDDKQICIANYSIYRSSKGREFVVFIRDFVGKEGTKVSSNYYQYDSLYYTFGNEESGGVTLLVERK